MPMGHFHLVWRTVNLLREHLNLIQRTINDFRERFYVSMDHF
jgi:hypothetical protein